MRYKGKLVIIGGAEDKGISKDESPDFKIDGILERIVQESSKKKKSRIEIVTTASQVPEQIGNDYIKAFGKLGVDDVHILNLDHHEQAREEKYVNAIKHADVVFFTGGDQLRLTALLGGSPVLDTIREKLVKENFIYAGSSAGAAAASDAMIFEGNSKDALLKGEIRISSGFGLVENVVFDTHFINRGRIGRLFQAVVSNPKLLGIGLEENTGLLFTGNKMEAIGPGMTILVDARHIRNSNLLEIKDGVPISIDNLTLHVMSKTDVYDLEKHELTIVTPEDCRI